MKEKLLNLENKTKNECKSFAPSADNNSHILILGSMPGVRSLEEQQYYAHPQNRFWKVMGAICDEPKLYELGYDLKLKTLLNNNIALWDTLKTCKRDGSLDSDIQNETPNDIRKLLKKYPNIKIICLNGNKSYSAFKKYFPDLLDKYNCRKMHSTSPANARYSLNRLMDEWKAIFV
ncbi:DNA-deoxyinosine glycosylase [bacterium]|nr:DNA-deoxyinosine glycosylase [bacterium]